MCDFCMTNINKKNYPSGCYGTLPFKSIKKALINIKKE